MPSPAQGYPICQENSAHHCMSERIRTVSSETTAQPLWSAVHRDGWQKTEGSAKVLMALDVVWAKLLQMGLSYSIRYRNNKWAFLMWVNLSIHRQWDFVIASCIQSHKMTAGEGKAHSYLQLFQKEKLGGTGVICTSKWNILQSNIVGSVFKMNEKIDSCKVVSKSQCNSWQRQIHVFYLTILKK